MNLTAEQLDTVQQMAERLMHPSLIATAIGMDETDFILTLKEPKSLLHERYYNGFIQAKMQLHESIIKSALNGSNPSQAEMKKLVTEAEIYING